MRAWRKKALAPFCLVACNAAGVVFTDERVSRIALASAYATGLCLALCYARVLSANDRGRVLTLPAAAGSPERRLTFREYDLDALRQLTVSSALAAGSAWAAHSLRMSTTWLLLQALLLPLAVFDSELVSLHCWRLPETRPELQRPFAGELAKAEAVSREVRALFRA